MKVSVKCPKCGKELSFDTTEQMVEKGVIVCCNNLDCKNKFRVEFNKKEIRLPQQRINGTETFAGVIANKDLEVLLEVLPNKFNESQQFTISAEYNFLGRKNNSGPEFAPDVAIATIDKTVSRIHAVIQKKKNGMYTLKDLKSANGTFLNEQFLEDGQEMYISNGDLIKLGNHLIIRVVINF